MSASHHISGTRALAARQGERADPIEKLKALWDAAVAEAATMPSVLERANYLNNWLPEFKAEAKILGLDVTATCVNRTTGVELTPQEFIEQFSVERTQARGREESR
jgi:hypothetical protein